MALSRTLAERLKPHLFQRQLTACNRSVIFFAMFGFVALKACISSCPLLLRLAQVQESDHASLEKERQLAAVKQELQAFRFDQATRELQQEREKEVQLLICNIIAFAKAKYLLASSIDSSKKALDFLVAGVQTATGTAIICARPTT